MIKNGVQGGCSSEPPLDPPLILVYLVGNAFKIHQNMSLTFAEIGGFSIIVKICFEPRRLCHVESQI